MSPVEERFDDLSKALATKQSRRAVLKAGLGVAGAALASALPGRAWADGNSAAAHFCNQAFPPGPQRGKCKSEAAHGRGPFVECGGDLTRICPGGTVRCCPPGEVCCGTTGCCKVGELCNPATGQCLPAFCGPTTLCTACPAPPEITPCICVQSVEGVFACANVHTCGGERSPRCSTSAECVAIFGAGALCARGPCCVNPGTEPRCVAACPPGATV
jgi:hypothetical protein